ncbi:MAG: phosphonate C-P lyase system protein PhnG, partial [Phreatobacter sp.]
MATVARATVGELAALDAMAGDRAEVLRAPEIGLVMVRGRVGGDGAPFNLGEATVTRAAVALPDG